MTAQEAYDYIANIIPDFQQKGNALYAQLHAANILRSQIRSVGGSVAEINQVYSEIEQDITKWNEIKDMLVPVLSYFGYSGLGLDFFTLALIGGTLIAIVSLMVSFYDSNRIDAHSQALTVIARNLPLSAEDRAIVDSATSTNWFSGLFSGLGNIGNYLLWGGLIYLGITVFKK